ncbi:hypothetical protein HYH02_006532 [Chlamydomonas schloesseri]|uniref:DEAD box RNA helicase n=1 Tax=Chlamydomonas schloesseri TaxID=2026947 RepID=A0A835WJL1_9CHLO|nr:hypothetical protein HYH02_006532 [Chlamydomonas schloesseri]|eukprot:KAG2448645.1 hypothetical protein HYH02_006532 [Chlamydomonas schloesseri]
MMLSAGGLRGAASIGGGIRGAGRSPTSLAPAPATNLGVLRPPLPSQTCPYSTNLRGGRQLTVVHVSRPSAPASGSGASSGAGAAAKAPRTFEQLGLNPALVTALHGMGISEPTDIQSLAVPALTGPPANYFLASHTGSGKTLAYLLPLVHNLKAQEAAGFVPKPKRPRVLVLGPTRELTDQINAVAKRLCHTAKFRAACVNAFKGMSEQARQLAGPVDVLVATPTRFLQHVREGNVAYRDIQWLVVDEADTVFEQGWGAEVAQIMAPLRAKPQPAHVLMVSATLTKKVQKAITELVPDAKELKTSTLHRAVSGSQHAFLALPPGGNKLALLGEVLSADSRRRQKTLVFCNTVDSCRAVEHYAREEGLAVVCYHGDMPPEARQESIATFAGATPDMHGGQPLMIATDLAARGLDFPGTVDHVVNFDFPLNSVDYLHRTGRTARAGATGSITSIVSKRDKVLAQRLQYALEHDQPLDGISADPDVLPPTQIATKQRERENDKAREAVAVLGPKGLAKLRATSKAQAERKGGRGAGKAAAKAAKPTLRGSVRGAARFVLLEERLAQRNADKGKGNRDGGQARRSTGGPEGGRGGRGGGGGRGGRGAGRSGGGGGRGGGR